MKRIFQLFIAGLYFTLSAGTSFALPLDTFETKQSLTSYRILEEKLENVKSKESVGGRRSVVLRLISGAKTHLNIGLGENKNELFLGSWENSKGEAAITWQDFPLKLGRQRFAKSLNLKIREFLFNNVPSTIAIELYEFNNEKTPAHIEKYNLERDYHDEIISIPLKKIEIAKLSKINLILVADSNVLTLACAELNNGERSLCKRSLLESRGRTPAIARAKKGKGGNL